MRIARATLLCTLALIASGGAGARADDRGDVEKELKKLQGTWTFVSVEVGGKEVPAAHFKGITVTFKGDRYTVKKGDEVFEAATQKLDPSRSPKTLDVVWASRNLVENLYTNEQRSVLSRNPPRVSEKYHEGISLTGPGSPGSRAGPRHCPGGR